MDLKSYLGKIERLSVKENIYKYINVINTIMTTKPYSVTLDKENVKRAKKLIKDRGGKLSPILDRLLAEWLDKEEEKDGNTR